MGVPISQQIKVALYILKKKLQGQKKYPLVLMLEPLFQCNLACAGCGKIDYPKEILKKRMTVESALQAIDECGAPIISIPGGEPLIHQEMPILVKRIIEKRKYVYLCTNAILLEKKMEEYTPSKYLTFSVHLDGKRERHDQSVCKEGVFDKAVRAIQLALSRGFRVNINCTLFNEEDPHEVADFFDFVTDLGVEGITVSPGYSYQHAPQQHVFLARTHSKQLFREIFKIGQSRKKKWPLSHSSLYLDFLAGNQAYQCTPWSNPTYNIFGWQKPCYLLVDEGHTDHFKDLMKNTAWDQYGTGRNPKCDQCMAHCGYEGSAVADSFAHPFKALRTFLKGPETQKDMVPDLPILYTPSDFNTVPIEVIPLRKKEG